VAGVSIGLALPFVLIAFMINPINEFSDKRRRPDYKSSTTYWTSLLTNAVTLRFISNMLWWQKFRAKFKLQPTTTKSQIDYEKALRTTLARTGQKFAYAAIGANLLSDQYINEAEANDPALASVNEASHEVDYSFLTRSC
jgi:hypothetical protein